MTAPIQVKILGRKAYGSIGHLPNSRLGPGDHSVHEGQGRICTEKARDKHDRIIVQEKLDGSCTAVALVDGVIHPLGRAGWAAESSKYLQHRYFAQWVRENEDRFRAVLQEGERIVGEWLAQAHGTRYDLSRHEPWAAFDIMRDDVRLPYDEFCDRLIEMHERTGAMFEKPSCLHVGGPISVEAAMRLHEQAHYPCDELEGVVYRVERRGEVDFLAKWVRPDKVDGSYLETVTGNGPVWNWQP